MFARSPAPKVLTDRSQTTATTSSSDCRPCAAASPLLPAWAGGGGACRRRPRKCRECTPTGLPRRCYGSCHARRAHLLQRHQRLCGPAERLRREIVGGLTHLSSEAIYSGEVSHRRSVVSGTPLPPAQAWPTNCGTRLARWLEEALVNQRSFQPRTPAAKLRADRRAPPTRREKGSLRMSRSVDFWYLRISISARVPGL
jgi:hypothetical protein